MREAEKTRKLENRMRLQQAMMDGSMRYIRANQFALQVLSLMQDFIPTNLNVRAQIHEHLIETAFEANAAFINVPPECDAMDKAALEKHTMEEKLRIISK